MHPLPGDVGGEDKGGSRSRLSPLSAIIKDLRGVSSRPRSRNRKDWMNGKESALKNGIYGEFAPSPVCRSEQWTRQFHGNALQLTKANVRGSAYKPGSVPRRSAATVIYLARRLPGRSSDLPEGHNGPDQPCPHIWSCSRWGLPSQPVARLLVRSYFKAPKRPHRFTLTPRGAVYFLLHFPYPSPPTLARRTASDGGRYPPPRPMEPGLSSPRSAAGRRSDRVE
jgi:hypothetical protein